MPQRVGIALSLLFLASSGCIFYDEQCLERPGVYSGERLRDPQTGLCADVASYRCEDSCGLCTAGEADGRPNWGECDTVCETLDEATCLGVAGCRGIYVEGQQGRRFVDCWAIDQSGPVQGGSCEGLEAQGCSRHDDCVAVHAEGRGDRPGEFVACADELPAAVSCSSHADCQPGQHCNAEELCLPPPDCAPGEPCPQVCSGYCVDNDGSAGDCYAEVSCDRVAPACPEGTLAGVRDGCWTGYCVPQSHCPDEAPQSVACSELTEEAACVQRSDCTALYRGVDCGCDGDSCTCAGQVFARCE
jgi:hypothetical protein